MSTEIELRQGGVMQVAEPSIMDIISQAAKDPSCDVGKMKELIAMKKDVIAFGARQAYNQAMIACQAEMGPVVKNCKNGENGSKYANLEAVDLAIKPIYQKHGFAISVHNPDVIDGQLVVSAEVLHKGGHAEKYSVQFANDSKGPKGGPVKTEIQGSVSTISYATRVLKCKIFDITIVNSDNDGVRPAQLITEEEEFGLRNLIEHSAGSPQAAVSLTAAVLRVTRATELGYISAALLPTAKEYCAMVAERRAAK